MKKVKWVEKYDRCGNPVMLVVGKDGVTQIDEHRAAGEGDKWYYDVVYGNGNAIHRIFNPISSYLEESPPENNEESTQTTL